MAYPYETAAVEQKAIGTWWWCVHHEIHLEQLKEPVENRVAYIRENKPGSEIDRRLRELAPVLYPERIPNQFAKAWDEHDKAWAAYDKAWAAYNKARDEHDKAWAAYDKAWAAYNKARAEHDKAWAAYDKAWAAYDKAWAAYNKARAEHEMELAALHLEEYPNTQWNGKSIFNAGVREDS
jgi:tetratricopeptide (TPR) repeat protein